MSDSLEFTGERFTPECQREIWYEHFHRYAFAAQFAAGAQVLDAACGEGYGSALLARTAASVTGVDAAAEAIEHARRRYGGATNLAFQVADCTRLPFEDGCFDRVVSFETLEHLAAQEQLLSEFRRVLRPQGFLLLSSPDRAVYSDPAGAGNPYHVRELYRHELEALIAREFPAFRLLGQKLLFHSAIWDLDGARRVGLQTRGDDGELRQGRVPHAPMYFIALCAASEDCLPPTEAGLWLFDDAAESVYRHYHAEIRRNMAAGGLLAERDAELERLRRGQAAARPWWRRLFGRD